MLINLNMYKLLKDFCKLKRKIMFVSFFKFEVKENFFNDYEIRLLEIIEEYDYLIDNICIIKKK